MVSTLAVHLLTEICSTHCLVSTLHLHHFIYYLYTIIMLTTVVHSTHASESSLRDRCSLEQWPHKHPAAMVAWFVSASVYLIRKILYKGRHRLALKNLKNQFGDLREDSLTSLENMVLTIMKPNCFILLSCLLFGLQSCFQAIWTFPLYDLVQYDRLSVDRLRLWTVDRILAALS